MAYFTYDGIENYSTLPKWIVSGFLILLITSFEKINYSFFTSRIIVFWFLFVTVYLIGSIYSYNPWQAIVFSTPLILSPLIAYHLFKIELSKLSLGFVILLFPLIIIVAYEILGWIISGDYTRDKTYELQWFYGHRNHLAELLSLGIPLSLIGFLKLESNSSKITIICFIVISLIEVALIQNRTSSILCFIVYPMIALILYLYYKFNMNKRILRIVLILSGVAVISSLVFLVHYFQTTSNNSGEERLIVWNKSIDLIKEKPIFGHGTNDWKIEIQRTDLSGTQAEGARVFFQRAHNIFIQSWTENGIIGFSLLILFFGVSIMTSINKIRVGEYFSGGILLAGILGFLLIGLLSFPLERIELLVMLFLIIGVSIQKGEPIHSRILKPIHLSILVGVLVVLGNWFLNEKKFCEYKQTGNLSEGLAVNANFYSIDAVAVPTDWYFGNEYFEKGDYKQALKHYRLAENRNPNNPNLLNNIGGCEYQLGNKKIALSYYEKVLKSSPFNVDANMNLAVIHFNDKNFDRALEAVLKIREAEEPDNYDQVFSVVLFKLTKDPWTQKCLEDKLMMNSEVKVIKKIIRDYPSSYLKALQKYCENV